VGVYAAFWIAFAVSACVAGALAATSRAHARWTADTLSGPQKVHTGHIPRVGGIAIAVGFCVAVLLAKLEGAEGASIVHPVGLIAALLVPFLAGLYEDITKAFGATLRLLATFVAAAIAFYACNAAIVRFDMPLLDAMLAAAPIASLLFTMFCVGGVAHAFNLSDGLDGLLGGLTLLAAAVLAALAWSHRDMHVFICAITLAGATLGFLLFNVPRARLFAGDSGAYFVGTAIALLAILLVARNPSANPWAAFLAVLYPFIDTTAAIVRRLIQRRPIMQPDAEHLHTLLRRRWMNSLGSRAAIAASFAIVAAMSAVSTLAISLRDSTLTIIAIYAVTAIAYGVIWWMLANQLGTLRGRIDESDPSDEGDGSAVTAIKP
jgi:UDP-GlcNAc:undecaprenyl-phosphate/decaprenyl-phosphate GlcNAc-1-phosphate transferase